MKVYILLFKSDPITVKGVYMNRQEAEMEAASVSPKYWRLYFDIEEWEVQ